MHRFKGAPLTVERVSGYWRTPAYPAGSGPDFVNACAIVTGALTPVEVLTALHAIEADMGRVRQTRWGQRRIDIDLLAAEDAVLPDLTTWMAWKDMPLDQQMARAPDQLILPHPRLQDRGFVLVPMAQIAPDWRHPVLGCTVREMLAALDPAETQAILGI